MGKRKNRSHGGKSRALILLEYTGVRIAAALLQLMGPKLIYHFGWLLAHIGFVVDIKHRKLACRQISESFPEKSPAEVRKIARQAMYSAIMMGIETVVAPKYINMQTLEKYVDIVAPEKIKAHIVPNGSGPVLVTGHYGNWEIGGYVLAHLGFEGMTLARPLDNPLLDKYIRSLRAIEKVTTADKKGGVRRACRAIKEGKFAGFIADQHAGRRGEYVDFFGRPASTFGSIALIAKRFNSPVLVCCVRRLPGGLKFKFCEPHIITPDQWADQENPEHWITQRFTKLLEDDIREDPGQYFGWLHNRWRSYPRQKPGEIHEAEQ